MSKTINDKNDIKKYFEDFRECTFKAIVDIFSYIGEESVKKAREDHEKNWKDQTGNLRSSIGYMVTYNGKEVLRNGFAPTQGKTGNGAEGQAEGQRVIEGLKGTNTEGFALIVVAGMNYAEHLEASGKYDVLAHVELFARKRMPEMLERIPEGIEKEMKKKGW